MTGVQTCALPICFPVTIFVSVFVGVCVFVGVFVGVWVFVGVFVGVCVCVGVFVGVGVGVGVGQTFEFKQSKQSINDVKAEYVKASVDVVAVIDSAHKLYPSVVST